MRGGFPNEVLKVWLYATAAVLLGAWLCPLLYNGGKALAEVSSVKQTNGPLQWLAGICRTAELPEFFKISLLAAAVVLFLPFIQWLQAGRRPTEGRHLPDRTRGWNGGQRLQANPRGPRQAVTGFLLVTMVFSLIAGVLLLTGVFQWKSPGQSVAKLVLGGFASALGLATLQEILFRGVALGIFLRTLRPLAALALSAVLFAFAHFLTPPPGLSVLDPDASGVGFELLGKLAARIAEPRILLATIAPLLALGVVLAYARWRTASLWLPVGLHGGWLFVNATLASVTAAATQPDSMILIISGASLRQGLVPLAGIVIAGLLTHYLTRPDDPA